MTIFRGTWVWLVRKVRICWNFVYLHLSEKVHETRRGNVFLSWDGYFSSSCLSLFYVFVCTIAIMLSVFLNYYCFCYTCRIDLLWDSLTDFYSWDESVQLILIIKNNYFHGYPNNSLFHKNDLWDRFTWIFVLKNQEMRSFKEKNKYFNRQGYLKAHGSIPSRTGSLYLSVQIKMVIHRNLLIVKNIN